MKDGLMGTKRREDLRWVGLKALWGQMSSLDFKTRTRAEANEKREYVRKEAFCFIKTEKGGVRET